MATFNAINQMPGVYIREIDVPGPIAGVSTSIAAFLGPALNGDVLRPTRLTNFTQFANQFGVPDADSNPNPYFTDRAIFAPHAVRGFFDNGGAACYFVRVSNERRASLTLNDRAGVPALVVRALAPGDLEPNLPTVEVLDASLADPLQGTGVAAVRQASALTSATGTEAVLPNAAAAANFRAGDVVTLEEGGATDTVTIVSIADATVRFGQNLDSPYTNAGTMRIADLAAGRTGFRVDDVSNIHPGSTVEITNTTDTETHVVAAVNSDLATITLETGLGATFGMDDTVPDPDVTLRTLEFTLRVGDGQGNVTEFANLSMDPRHPNYVIDQTRGASTVVEVQLAGQPSTLPPNNLPAEVTPAADLQNGEDEDLDTITANDYADAL
ncbi:MAG: hypothetical protein O7D91_14585, partial [Planctomycetota bacterium]|nr:hypothetical protein [Planctomycetota bacterium]